MKHRVAVIGSFTLDSRKAHAINVCNIANGFAKLSNVAETFLFVRKPAKAKPSPSLIKAAVQMNNVQVIEFSSLEDLRDSIAEKKINFGYIRDYLSPDIFHQQGIPFVAESHAHPSNDTAEFKAFIASLQTEECLGLFTINELLKDNFISSGVSEQKCFIVPDSVNFENFNCHSDDTQYGAVYSGHLYPYKGIKTFLRASKFLPEINFTIVGGEKLHVLFWKLMKLIIGYKSNVSFTGWVEHDRIPKVLSKAKVLVLPPEDNHPSAAWTSPVKLGEYLATGKPLVCSKIIGLERWVKSPLCEWFLPGNAFSLAVAIQASVLEDNKSKNNLRKQYASTLDYTNKATAAVNLLDQGSFSATWEHFLGNLETTG